MPRREMARSGIRVRLVMPPTTVVRTQTHRCPMVADIQDRNWPKRGVGFGTPRARGRPFMDYKIELITLPVSDVDRAKAFYVDQCGFNADHDHTVSEEMRFVQLTPPG